MKSRKDLMTELGDYRRRLVGCEARCSRLVRELALCESRERRRLAEYLHDRLSQRLYFVEMKVHDLWEEKGDPRQAEILEGIQHHLHVASDELRDLLKEMYPQTLIHLGLVPALGAMAEEFRNRHQVEIAFDSPDDFPLLPEDLGHLVFRTARELVINALKHARTEKIWITVTRLENRIEVCVKDEGVGFDPERFFDKRDDQAHFGILSIRERLMPLGGRLYIESRPGKGTTTTFFVPFMESGIGKEGCVEN